MNIDTLKKQFPNNDILERMRIDIFHYMSIQHLGKYIDDASFRWNQKIPEIRITKERSEKVVKKPMPFMKLITILLKNANGLGLIRSRNGGILDKKFFSTSNFMKINQLLFGLKVPYFIRKLSIKNQNLNPLLAFRIGSSSMLPRVRS